MNYAAIKKEFEDYIRDKDLKHSDQRLHILDIFLNSKRHLTADNLYRMTKRKYPTIGHATVYRTLKLLCECGICRELRLEDGVTRYEPLYGHEHHDHLICIKCGNFEEVVNWTIEKLQKELARKKGFTLMRHKLEIYGVCRRCRKKE